MLCLKKVWKSFLNRISTIKNEMLGHFLVVMVINLFLQGLHVGTGHAIHFFPVLDQNEGGDVSDPVFLENKKCQGSLKKQ